MKQLCWLLLLFLLVRKDCFTQGTPVPILNINRLPPEGILLDKDWKFKLGDNKQWASPNYDDSNWNSVNINQPASSFPIDLKDSIVWLRLHFTLDSSLAHSVLSLVINQYGASEIYLDEQIVRRLGDLTSKQFVGFNPHNKPIPLHLNNQSNHLLAVRFKCKIPSTQWVLRIVKVSPLTIRIQSTDEAINNFLQATNSLIFPRASMTINLVFGFLFLVIYLFYRRQPMNLFFSLFMFSAAGLNYFMMFANEGQYGLSGYSGLYVLSDLLGRLTGSNLVVFVALALFQRTPSFIKWLLVYVLTLDFILVYLFPSQYRLINYCVHLTFTLTVLWLAIRALRNRNLKDWFIAILAFSALLVNVHYFLVEFWGIQYSFLRIIFPIISPPAMIIYLALKYAHANLSLEEQLVHVKKLSDENLRTEQEKQQILSSQNEMLEKQVAVRTNELKQSLEELKSTQSLLIQSEKMASLGELTAGIAHEIQNPLNFVNNFSEVNSELIADLNQEAEKGNLMEVKAIAKSLKENEEKILHHGKRADSIVKGMLQHSRTSSGQKEPTDINALCDEYLRLSYHGMRARDKSFNAAIQTDFDKSIGYIPVVPQDIGRVLLNLYNNAFFAVMEKHKQNIPGYEPTVTVTTRNISPVPSAASSPQAMQGGHSGTEITVMDNGVGISDQIKDKIFQPFFTTRATGSGTGLGLSLSYDIVKAHGGELKLLDVQDGAAFLVQLPAG